MKRLKHTVRLTITDDAPGPVQRSRELFSFYIAPASLLVIVINLAALLLTVRDVMLTLALWWSDGIGIILAVLLPVRFSFATG